MQIQWYPGHMHKASKQIKETLPKVDVIIEILDARIPYSSENPMLKTLRGDKPCIKILSKSDLADPEITQLWQTYFEQEHGVKTLALSLLQGSSIDSDKLATLGRSIVSDISESRSLASCNAPVRIFDFASATL